MLPIFGHAISPRLARLPFHLAFGVFVYPQPNSLWIIAYSCHISKASRQSDLVLIMLDQAWLVDPHVFAVAK